MLMGGVLCVVFDYEEIDNLGSVPNYPLITLITPYAGTVVGEAAGAIVGGFIGGGYGTMASNVVSGQPLTTNVGTGAITGAGSAAFAAPGVVLY